MGFIRIVNPKTGQTVIEEHDDGTIKVISEEYRKAMEEFADEGRIPTGEEIQQMVREIELAAGDVEPEGNATEGVVPYSSGPTDDSSSWDAAAARARIAKWASSDGSGSKDKINWGKYKKAFLIVDGDPENFGSYKYPHHDVKNGTLYVVWGGVKAAMSFLMKTSPPDKKAAYSHLSKHYKQFKKEPPPFKSEAYSDDEWNQYLAMTGESD